MRSPLPLLWTVSLAVAGPAWAQAGGPASAIPEPGALSLLALAGVGLLVGRGLSRRR